MIYNSEQLKKDVRPILEKLRERYVPEARDKVKDAELLGILVALLTDWSGSDIATVAQYAFEDANYHETSAEMKDLADNLA